MKLQYGNACLPLLQVYEWNRKFKNVVFTIKDPTQLGKTIDS